ncbi:hypothetical protein DXG01_012892 [Tephrocybe rancida]|nr:hypothetical protein DXG01_012892 [Tephrocybe rancida]
MDNDASDILGGPTLLNARDSQSGWLSSLPFGAKSVLVLLVFFALYVVGFRVQTAFLVWREKSYKLSMRRRHGIPDTDHRPFNVAYAAVLRARQEGEEQARQARVQELEQDHQSAPPDEGIRQRNGIPRNASTVRSIPGRYQSADVFSTAHASASNQARLSFTPNPSAQEHYNPNPTVRIADPEINNSPPKAGPSHRASAHVNDDRLERSFDDDESDSPEHAKQTRVGDEGMDGDQEPEWIDGPRRGWKRGHGEDIDDDDEANESMRIRDKRQRKVSLDKSSQLLNEDMDIDEEEEDEVGVLRSIARGKKRDRAEAGSTFGGDDEDDSSHEVDSEKARRHRKRRTYAKRKSDAGALARGKKRDRDLADDSEAENEDNTTLKASRKKRGKRASLGAHQDDRSDVSMDESVASSARSRPRRSIGDEWESNGVKYKIGPNGQRLRQTLVKKERQKFHMPQDSQHPDRQANLEVYIESWLTEEEYREAKDQQLLAWQDSNKPSVEPQTPTIESQEELPSAAGKNLLWKSTSAPTTGGTTTPRQITPPPATPHAKPRASDLFGSSVVSNVGLRINPFGSVAAGKRVSAAIRRPSVLKSDGSSTVPPSPTAVAPSLSDSTNNSPRHKAFSKWEKQDLEARAMMKMREANRLKEEERLAKLKKEQEAAAPAKAIPTITVTKADDAKATETKAPSFSFAPSPAPAPADASKKDAPAPLFGGPPKTTTQPLFAPPSSQPSSKPPTIPPPASSSGTVPPKPPTSLFGSKPDQLNSFVPFGPPSSSTPASTSSTPVPTPASANPGIPTSKPSYSFGHTPDLPQAAQAEKSGPAPAPVGGSLMSRLGAPSASASSPTTQPSQPPQPTFGFGKPPATEAPKPASAFATQPSSQPAPAQPAAESSTPKFSFGVKPVGAAPVAPSTSSSLNGALGPTGTKPTGSPFSFSKPTGEQPPAITITPAPAASGAAPPKFSFGMPSSSGVSVFGPKSPAPTPATNGTATAPAQPTFGGFGAKPAGDKPSTPAASLFGFGSKPATNGSSAPAQAGFAQTSTATAGSSTSTLAQPAFGPSSFSTTLGSSTSAPAQSTFGTFGSMASTPGSFGGLSSMSAPKLGGFGRQSAAGSSPTTVLAQPAFGNSGTFGAKPNGDASSAPAQSAFGGFGGVNGTSGSTSSAFGGSKNVFGGGTFGATASTTPSTAPAVKDGISTTQPLFSFGTPAVSSSTTPLGTPSAAPAPSTFGTSSAFGPSSNGTTAFGGFGSDPAKNSTTLQAQPATDSPFGKAADPSTFGFGAGNAFSAFGKAPASTGQQQQ